MSGDRFISELSYGAQLLADGRTRFRVWAPAQRQLALKLDALGELPMMCAADGSFELTVDCEAGAAYRYRLDDGSTVPDPASRAQRGGIDGDSLVVDPRAYRWRHPRWGGRPWHEAVIYELHVGCCGGYSGVRERLLELAALGVTAIELMPIGSFAGERNWGYDGVLPYAPQASYGSVEALKSLIDEAHGLGIMVLLDVVYNHFGPLGNALPRYAPAFFRDDMQTPWGAAIDFRIPQVRRYFAENALYWLQEYRFDGLRFDAGHAISEPGWLRETAAFLRAAIGSQRHIHLVLENERNEARHLRRDSRGRLAGGFDAQWNDDFHHAVHVLLTGESEAYYAAYAEQPAAHLARCLAEGFSYQGEDCPRDAAELADASAQPRGTPSAELPPQAFVAFLQNHDQIGNRAFGERLGMLVETPLLLAATSLLLLIPQVPMLFMGEEWNSQQPFLYFTDYSGELAGQVRSGRRQEFARFAAFADARLRDGIPDPNAPETFARSCLSSIATRDASTQRWHQHIGELLQLRRQRLWAGFADARSLGARACGAHAVEARWQLADGQQLVLHSNLGPWPTSIVRPELPLLYTSPPLQGQAPDTVAAHTTVAWLG